MITSAAVERVEIPAGTYTIHGDLRRPPTASGLIIFAHGSRSSRFSARNHYVAEFLNRHPLATLLLDLLTKSEQEVDDYTAKYRFDIEGLGRRVSAAVDWASLRTDLQQLPIGCFGASTGAAAALRAAADRPASISAVVSRGGRPDLAGDALRRVEAPTLLIVGGHDEDVIELNRIAMQQMRGLVQLELVPGATHLFQEPGALEQVSRLAVDWFERHLASPGVSASVVPANEWTGFLESFSLRHRAWLTSVATVTPGGAPQELVRLRPLDGIQVIRDRGHIIAFEIRFQDAEAPPSVVALAPKLLRVDETPRGAERGLEIEDQYGLRTSIRFRATALAVEVDGLTPAEL